MIQASNLAFKRNDKVVFEDLHFKLPPGQALQVLGANGSGKTTLLKVLCCLLKPTEGAVHWHGKNIHLDHEQYLCSLAYLGHKIALKDNLTVEETLQTSRCYGPWRNDIDVDNIIHQLNLERVSKQFCHTLSAGQRQRVAVARLLLRDAALWILDEPFTAMDKTSIDLLKTLIIKHVSQNGMVVFTSHQTVNFAKTTMQQLNL